jgi:type VI secretion system protein ImpK
MNCQDALAMTDEFANLVMPLFQKALRLLDQLSWGESRTGNEVLDQATKWINQAVPKTTDKPELARSFELAKYGLVTWIDEILTESTWGESVGWSVGSQLLEWSIYETRDGGWKYWQAAARAEKEGDLDALEVYLLCATLGFKGTMADNEAGLSEWVDRVYERVAAGSSIAPRPFPEDEGGAARFAPLRGPSLLLRVSILVAFTAIYTLAAYLLAVHLDYSYGAS